MAGDARRATVGDYVTLVRGTTYKGQLVGKPGPALLGLGSIEPGGGFRTGNYKTYGGDCPEELMLFPGDVYASLKGATKDGKMIGSVARVPPSVPTGRLTQDTVKLVFRCANPQDATYLYWVLRTPQYRDYCAGHAMGSAVVALSRRDFLSYPVPPPTMERQKVVGLLDAIEEKIELNRKMNEMLEAMARALFKSWFVDFDPVRAKMDGRDPGLPKETADLFPSRMVESELGEIPEGWGPTCVDDEFSLTMGQSPPGKTYNEAGVGLPFYQGRADFELRFPRRRVYCSAPTRFASRGDTLISVRAPVGDVNLAAEDCAIGRGVAAARHKSGSRSYTYEFMRSMEEVFSRFDAEGTVFGSISKKDFHAIPCVAPNQTAVDAFEKLVAPLDSRIERALFESRTLAALRDALLPKLISGEIRIRNPERLIETAAA